MNKLLHAIRNNDLLSVQQILDEVNVQKPTADLDRVHLSHLSFESAELMFHFKVANPNTLGVRLSRFDYEFQINGNRFLSGKQESGLEIPARGRNTVELPVSLPFKEIVETYRSLQGKDSAAYRISTSFSFELPIVGEVKVPLTKDGTFPVIKVPTITFDGLKLNRLDITGANLTLGLKLTNPNAFSLLMKHVNVQLKINGKEWARISRDEEMHVAREGSGRFVIPVNLNFLQMGQSVYSIITGNANLNYDLKADFDFSTSHPLLGDESLDFIDSGILRILK